MSAEMSMSGTLVCKIRGHVFDFHLRTPNEWNSQRYWQSLTNIEGNKIRVPQ